MDVGNLFMVEKIWISAGGTGGHLFPALALAAELRDRYPEVEILFLGGGLASSRYFDRLQVPFVDIPCGSFVSKNPVAVLRSLSRIARGVIQSRQLLRVERPDVLVGFGSFFSFPPLVGAKWAGVPLVLHAADAIPGRVIRLMARHAALTVLQFPEAAAYLQGATAVAQMPLRAGLRCGLLSREEACATLGLSGDKRVRTLLVFGGSQGARRINQVVGQMLQARPLPCAVQVLHYTGDVQVAEQLAQQYRNQGIVACVKPFEARMDLAWSAADIVIGRSGASTIAELCEFEVPGILIPYPHAMDNHQEHNARILERAGGVRMLRERDVNVESLGDALVDLLKEDGKRLGMMRDALRSMKSQRSKQSLCDLVMQTAQEGVGK